MCTIHTPSIQTVYSNFIWVESVVAAAAAVGMLCSVLCLYVWFSTPYTLCSVSCRCRSRYCIRFVFLHSIFFFIFMCTVLKNVYASYAQREGANAIEFISHHHMNRMCAVFLVLQNRFYFSLIFIWFFRCCFQLLVLL